MKNQKIVVLLFFQFILDIGAWFSKAITNIEKVTGTLTQDAKDFIQKDLPGIIQFLNFLKAKEQLTIDILNAMIPGSAIVVTPVMKVLDAAINDLLKVCGYSDEVIAALNSIDEKLPKIQEAINSVTDAVSKETLFTNLAVALGNHVNPNMPANADVLVHPTYVEMTSHLAVAPMPEAPPVSL